jgi:polysaccharide pyruvyl transferase WcaK-like protein
LIVVNGEGTLHPQQQTEIWLPVMAWLARRTGASLWVVNCSIQVDDRRAEPLFRAALGAAERIVVREPLSLAECGRLGLSAEQGADCAFLAEPAPSKVADEILGRLGVRTPYAIVTGGASAWSWQPEHVAQWVSILRERGLDVLFAASTSTDRELHASAAPETPMLKAEDADYRELLALIRGASLHVGGRYHPAIFAAMSGTPTITLQSNTHKMEGLAQLLNTAAGIYNPTEAEALLGILGTLDFITRDDGARERSIELREFARRSVFEGSGA